MSDYNIDKCPHCGGASILVRAATWINFADGVPVSFDAEGHLDCVDPIVGGSAFCLTCNRDEWDIERSDARRNGT
jgi:hypothetical protein